MPDLLLALERAAKLNRMGRLTGKTAIISGAARGQGAAEARLFVAEGAQVVMGDVLDEQGEALAEELSEAACYLHLDVASPDDWLHAAKLAEEMGPVNVLVNNAGIHWVCPIEDEQPDKVLQMFSVNALGNFLGIQAVREPMRRAGGGSVVNISSVAGMTGIHGHVAYGMSKWAVRGLTKIAAMELGPLGIRVNSIHPGPIDTAMLPDRVRDTPDMFSHLPLGRAGQPEEVAQLALYLASDDSSFQSGGEYIIDGGGWAGHPPRN